MKNIVLVGVALLLIASVFIIRYVFRQKLELFKTEIAKYDSTQLENFRSEKQRWIETHSNGDNKLLQLFLGQFDENKSISERDTIFSFVYLSETIKHKVASLQYIDCLNSKCIIDEQNEVNQELIDKKEKELQGKYGQTFSIWYAQLMENRLWRKIDSSVGCSNFFPDVKELSYDENAWNDFEQFMIAYDSDIKESNFQNRQAQDDFSTSVYLTKNQLRSNIISYFDEKLSDRKSQIISTQSENRSYNSPSLGLITYTVDKTSFDKQAFKEVADNAFEEQWKYNSLYTGAMPYSDCFGSRNYCDSYGCSRITVQTGSTDALVTIKDGRGDIVRHGYIRGGDSFSFNLPDGTYQVFFYSGTGWNPNKIMSSSSCGSLRGGFVSNEEVTKAGYQSLFGQELTIELILQQNGNLRTEPSSKEEAL